jgi:hypothetical protein
MIPAVLAGCDSDAGRVAGRVTFDGQSVEGVGLVFHPDFEGGTIATGKTDADGYYKAMLSHSKQGVLVGKHHITFQYDDDEDNENATDAGIIIPSQYTSSDSTPCTIEIRPGSNTFNYDIKSDKPQ